MPHIHAAKNQIDYTADTFIVHVETKRVLLRLHDKLGMWLVPGGHIELNETPIQAAKREIFEEVGLEVEIYSGKKPFEHLTERYEELIPPEYMNIHFITPDHRHISLVFFATSKSDVLREPGGVERSGGCLWLTKDELNAHPDIDQTIKFYGTKALELLAS